MNKREVGYYWIRRIGNYSPMIAYFTGACWRLNQTTIHNPHINHSECLRVRKVLSDRIEFQERPGKKSLFIGSDP